MLRVSGESVDDVLDGPVVLNRCANIVMYRIAVKKNAVLGLFALALLKSWTRLGAPRGR